ncbi:MAG: SMC-Scp complex subunit ScpB [Gammaproteobacteria bacterium]|nr:SMC-Scp complex subunit ScpB [Gammaproteobacteria bacterium]
MLAGVDTAKLKQIVEGALMAADEPLSVDRLVKLFKRGELDPAEGRQQIRDALRELGEEAAGRGYELKRVASGFRFQVRGELSEWIGRLWEEKPPRYSRALLETLALIAYKQPVTRGDIEQVRGVSVSQNIVRTLLERGWVRVVGQRETPGRPNLYGTTRAFLDYFNLKKLDELPPLAEIRSMIEPLVAEEDGEERTESQAGASVAPDDRQTGPEALGVEGDTEEPGKRLAEVVHLPTAGRSPETVREELHGE